MNEICSLSAVELARRIHSRELSAVEVMQAHLEQIERVNPYVNAIITLVPDQALAAAQAADEALASGAAVGTLHGLPIAHKDLVPTKGIRTTSGSPIYQDFVPEEDALIVERLRHAGAIALGKTNVPEFGAGSQTFNPVFGPTRNPYDLSKTAGGSSGGAAAALACRMLPIADGSDMGGSLRNPANFCNVVGFRPSAGRVPAWPTSAAWHTLSVLGPMARTVQDLALLFSAMAGPDRRSPISLPEPGHMFLRSLERDFKGVRLAWSRFMGGLPVDTRINDVIDAQRGAFESLGCEIDKAAPDFSGADEAFKILRALDFELGMVEEYEQHRDQLKDTVIWNIEQGRALSGPQVGWAERTRTEVYERVRRFMEDYEFLILPVSQVLPFDVNIPYPTEINGVQMETYIDWMKSCYYISLVGLPAISVPCGFTLEGLPVGVQIVGRAHDDFGVLQLAHAFEQATGFWQYAPPVAS